MQRLNELPTDGCFVIADDLKRQGKLDEAMAAYMRARQTSSNNLKPRYNDGLDDIHYMQNNTEDMIRAYTKIIECTPDDSLIYHRRGSLYLRAFKFNQGISDLLKALKLNPEFAVIKTIFDNMFKHTGFIEYLSEETKESFGKYYDQCGRVLYNAKKFSDAELCFTRAVSLSPNDSEAVYNRGCVYVQFKKYDEAIACLNRAIELTPQAFYYVSRGKIYEWQGKVLQALADWHSALSMEATNKDATEKLNEFLQGKDKEKLFADIQSIPEDQRLKTLLYATAPSTPQHELYKVMSQQRGALEPNHGRGMLKKLLHELNITLIKQSMGDAATPEVIQQFESENFYDFAGGYLLARHNNKPDVISKYFSILSNLVEQDKNIHQQIVWLLRLQNRRVSSLGHVLAGNYNHGLMYLRLLAKMLEQGLPPAEVLAILSDRNIVGNIVQHMIFRYLDMKAILLSIDILITLNQTESLREPIQTLLTDLSNNIFDAAALNHTIDMAVIFEKMLSAKLLPPSMAASVFKHISNLSEQKKYAIFTRAITEGDAWNSYFKNQPDILKKMDQVLLAAQVGLLDATEVEEQAAARMPEASPEIVLAAAAAPSAPPMEEVVAVPSLYPDVSQLLEAPVSIAAIPAAPTAEVEILPVVQPHVVTSANLFDDLLLQDNGDAPVVEFTSDLHIEAPSEKKVVPQVAVIEHDLIAFPAEKTAEEKLQHEKISKVLDAIHAAVPDAVTAKVAVEAQEAAVTRTLDIDDLLELAPSVPAGLPSMADNSVTMFASPKVVRDKEVLQKRREEKGVSGIKK